MTILTVLFLAVVSTCLAQSASTDVVKQRTSRAPQSQISYSDPDGSKVDWKLYAPQNQWRSHLESTQRLQRRDKGPSQENFLPKLQATMINPPVEAEPRYQPFSSVPDHIKKLIIESYNHEGPYVDPGAFFYQAYTPISVPLVDSRSNDDQPSHSQKQQQEYFKSPANYRTSGYSENIERTSTEQIGKVPPRGGIKAMYHTQRNFDAVPHSRR